MEHVQEQHFSFNSRMGSSPAEVVLKISRSGSLAGSLTIVFWANVLNEQWRINNLVTWKFLFKTHKLILKDNSRNTNWIVDQFTQVKLAEHMAKNQFQMHTLWCSFTPM